MNAGNTSSVNPPFSPPGSPNEAYASAPVWDHPEPDLGDVTDYARVVSDGADDAFAGYGWQAVPGVRR